MAFQGLKSSMRPVAAWQPVWKLPSGGRSRAELPVFIWQLNEARGLGVVRLSKRNLEYGRKQAKARSQSSMTIK